jgi:hypothetical protein
MITIESDDYDGYYMLVDDGIGMCKSKSRNVLVRVRDALNAIRETGLVGLTVESAKDTRGVVLALSDMYLVVRQPDNMLALWRIDNCRVVEPERPDKPTKFNDPEDIRKS